VAFIFSRPYLICLITAHNEFLLQAVTMLKNMNSHSKAVPLHALEVPGERGGIAHTCS
jgi:hypothetical protein